MSGDFSRTDLEALHRSGRGKLVVLGLVLVAALAAAGWSFLKPGGTGNPEELHRVMVVSPLSGRSIPLADSGFDAVEGSFAAWISKAEDEVPDLEVDGVEAIMVVADRFGYAWVIFENPKDVDFSGLEIEGGVPTMTETTRFAVVSAGDLAFPHRMTLNPEPSKVVRDTTTIMMQALFAQDEMAEITAEGEALGISALQLRDRVSDAVERVGRVPTAERMAEKVVEQVVDLLSGPERTEPKPTLVGHELEVTKPIPLPNGQVLSIAQGFDLVSRDGVRVELDLDKTEQFLVGAPGSSAADREACTALAGGSVSVRDSAKFWYAADGSALLIKTVSDGLNLWTLAADAPPCGFVHAGSVAPALPGLGDGAPVPQGVSGRVARAGYVRGQGVVSVVRAGHDEDMVLGMLDGIRLSDPRWIGDRFIVAIASSSPGGLVFFDVEQPMLALGLSSLLFDGASDINEFAIGGTPEAPALAVVAGDDVARLYALTPGSLQQLFDNPPVDAELAQLEPEAVRQEREGLPTVVLMDTNAFDPKLVTATGGPRNVVVSGDGSKVAFRVRGDEVDAVEPGDSEVAVASMNPPEGGGGVRVMTLNALKDYTPRFTADGKHLTFRTRLDVPRTEWVITAGRVTALE